MGKYKLKIALLGEFGSGKSSIYRRLVDNEFDPEAAEEDLECDYAELDIECKGHQCKVSLWDTAGMEEHDSIEGSYFRGLVGFLLVYDVCSWKSYERIEFWKEQVGNYAVDGVKLVLLGNKCDVPKKKRVVEEYEGKTLAASLKIPFFETSALDGTSCREALEALVEAVVDSDIPGICVEKDAPKSSPGSTEAATSETVNLSQSDAKKKKKCC